MYDYIDEEGLDSPFFTFNTDKGLSYYVAFRNMEIENAPLNKLYSVDFGEIDNRKDSEDPKVSTTIIGIINHFLTNDTKNIIHFVCDSNDDRHHCRQKLFSNWYIKNCNEETIKYDIEIESESYYELSFIFNPTSYPENHVESEIILMLDTLEREKI